MSRKVAKPVKKVKTNLNKPEPRKVIHLNYLRVYHEVLKHEEILDIELDDIFNATVEVIDGHLVKMKMSVEPEAEDIEVLVSEVMQRLTQK